MEERTKTFAEIIKEYGLNDEQVEFYKQYSMQRSAYRYEKVAAEKIGSAELVKDWKYKGYYDSGYRGADHCSLGHALRYVHIAENQKTKEIVKFGIKCVSDFFNITPAQIKFIKQGFNEANKEILDSIDKYVQWKGDFDAYEKKYHYKQYFEEVVNSGNASLLKFSYDEFENLLKIGEINCIFELKLFLPDSFEWYIERAKRQLDYENRKKENLKKLMENELKIDQEVLKYLRTRHIVAWKTAQNIIDYSNKKELSESQEILLRRLMSTNWETIDTYIDNVNKKQNTIKKGYEYIYKDLLDAYTKYGFTKKQEALFMKAIE